MPLAHDYSVKVVYQLLLGRQDYTDPYFSPDTAITYATDASRARKLMDSEGSNYSFVKARKNGAEYAGVIAKVDCIVGKKIGECKIQNIIPNQNCFSWQHPYIDILAKDIPYVVIVHEGHESYSFIPTSGPGKSHAHFELLELSDEEINTIELRGAVAQLLTLLEISLKDRIRAEIYPPHFNDVINSQANETWLLQQLGDKRQNDVERKYRYLQGRGHRRKDVLEFLFLNEVTTILYKLGILSDQEFEAFNRVNVLRNQVAHAGEDITGYRMNIRNTFILFKIIIPAHQRKIIEDEYINRVTLKKL